MDFEIHRIIKLFKVLTLDRGQDGLWFKSKDSVGTNPAHDS